MRCKSSIRTFTGLKYQKGLDGDSMMRKHGEKVEVSFNVRIPVNVCNKCREEFILLRVVDHSNEIWEQVANGLGLLHCPYCGEKL